MSEPIKKIKEIKVPQRPVRVETSKNGKPLFIFQVRRKNSNKYYPTGGLRDFEINDEGLSESI